MLVQKMKAIAFLLSVILIYGCSSRGSESFDINGLSVGKPIIYKTTDGKNEKIIRPEDKIKINLSGKMKVKGELGGITEIMADRIEFIYENGDVVVMKTGD